MRVPRMNVFLYAAERLLCHLSNPLADLIRSPFGDFHRKKRLPIFCQFLNKMRRMPKEYVKCCISFGYATTGITRITSTAKSTESGDGCFLGPNGKPRPNSNRSRPKSGSKVKKA